MTITAADIASLVEYLDVVAWNDLGYDAMTPGQREMVDLEERPTRLHVKLFGVGVAAYLAAREGGRSHNDAKREAERALYLHVGLPDPFPPPPLDRLTAGGRMFLLAGAPFRVQEATAFTDWIDWVQHKDNGAFLRHLQHLGVNTLRVLLRWFWAPTGRFDHRSLGDSFQAYLASYLADRPGWRFELVPGVDVGRGGTVAIDPTFYLSRPELERLIAQTCEVAEGFPGVVVEHGNELEFNGVPTDLSRVPGPVLQCRGSGGGRVQPYWPPMDYVSYHNARGPSLWQVRQVGKQAGEFSWGAGEAFDPWQRSFPHTVLENEGPKPIAGNDDPEDAYTMAAFSAIFCAGSCIHTDPYKSCTVPDGSALAWATAWAQAWKDVPIDAPLGHYSRGLLTGCPLYHEDRLDGNDNDINPRGCVRTFVNVREKSAVGVCGQPGAQWPGPVAQNGWSLIDRRGPRGQVAILEN